jgi:hypothetical protein
LPEGFTDFRFWPIGTGTRARDPLAEAGDRLLIVSPFISQARLEELADGRGDVTLVSSGSEIDRLPEKPKGVGKVYRLLERATIEFDPEQDERPASDVEAIEQSDLHAKLYVSEVGWDAHIWTGSANATDAAFNRNVECLVELVGPRKRFGIDSLMEPQKGEVRLINLLEPVDQFKACDQTDPDVVALEAKLEEIRDCLACAPLAAIVTPAQASTYSLHLTYKGSEKISIPRELSVRCWPVTITSSAGLEFTDLDPNTDLLEFPGLSFPAITAFFAFEIRGQVRGEARKVRFVLNLPLEGAPEGRREHVLRSLVRDRTRMLRFLWLLLADEGVPIPEPTNLTRGTANGQKDNVSFLSSGLFERLMLNLDRSPERLDHLNNVLQELRNGPEGEDLLPEGFDAIWQPIWRQRERLRAKTKS